MITTLLAESVNIPNPDGWLDAFVIIIVTAMVAIPSWLAMRNQKSLSGIEKQVSNGHARPLREDLDSVIENINKLSNDISIIRRELIDEEERRRSHVGDVHDSLNDLRKDMHRRIGNIREESAGTINEMKNIHSKLADLEKRFDA